MNSTDDTSNEPEGERGHFGKGTRSLGDAQTATAVTDPDHATDTVDDGRHMGELDAGHAHGPSDGDYFRIFWILFAVTALEVSTYWWDRWFGETGRIVGIVVLLVLMVVKFWMIAAYFMHLKWDPNMLRRTFTFGLGVALAVYLVALSAMNIFDDNGNPFFDDPPPAVTTTVVDGN